MSDSTLWWLLAGFTVALELFTGTFYLLMLAVGLAAGALAAHAGLGLAGQLSVAAFVGSAAVVACYTPLWGLWLLHQCRVRRVRGGFLLEPAGPCPTRPPAPACSTPRH